MQILKPQKIFFDKLSKIESLINEINVNDKINNIILEEYKEESIEINDITIEKSVISNTNIINSNLSKNTFVDIEFKN